MSKIIMLDIDGPMIPVRAFFLPNQTPIYSIFDPCAVAMLNRLIVLSDAKLVMTSTWSSKGYDVCKELLDKNGVEYDFHEDWTTPKKLTSTRVHEIQFWLSEHPEVTDWVALDDERLDVAYVPNLVQCDTYEGFSYRNFLEASKFLGEITDQQLDEITYLKRKEIWRTKRAGEPDEHLTWQFANELFPIPKI